MHTITGIGGKELERDKTKGVKVRLAETFRREGQKMTEIMGEIKELTPRTSPISRGGTTMRVTPRITG
jgi:hypothetical protein